MVKGTPVRSLLSSVSVWAMCLLVAGALLLLGTGVGAMGLLQLSPKLFLGVALVFLAVEVMRSTARGAQFAQGALVIGSFLLGAELAAYQPESTSYYDESTWSFPRALAGGLLGMGLAMWFSGRTVSAWFEGRRD